MQTAFILHEFVCNIFKSGQVGCQAQDFYILLDYCLQKPAEFPELDFWGIQPKESKFYQVLWTTYSWEIKAPSRASQILMKMEDVPKCSKALWELQVITSLVVH